MAAISYLDASAIVKLIVREDETDAMEMEVVTRDALFSSRLSLAEVHRAVRRAHTSISAERLQERVAEIFDALFFIDINADVLHTAASIGPEILRTGDAIHLSTALALEDAEVEFITYDARLAQAALQAGLRVVQPGRGVRTATLPLRSR